VNRQHGELACLCCELGPGVAGWLAHQIGTCPSHLRTLQLIEARLEVPAVGIQSFEQAISLLRARVGGYRQHLRFGKRLAEDLHALRAWDGVGCGERALLVGL
jgi:hypothetical protein